jgi:hypothetical protein
MAEPKTGTNRETKSQWQHDPTAEDCVREKNGEELTPKQEKISDGVVVPVTQVQRDQEG